MKYPANISSEEYAAMEEGYEQGRASVAAEVAAAERRVRQAVWNYCKSSAEIAEENFTNAYAVGMAKAYRDVMDKLAPAPLERP